MEVLSGQFLLRIRVISERFPESHGMC